MPPYRFRLAAVERVRESLRDDARRRLADGHLAADKLAHEAARVEREITAVKLLRKDEASAERPVADRMIALQRHEATLRAQQTDLARKRQLVDGEIARRREALAQADRQVRVLRTLDDRARERHRRAEAAAEQLELDENALIAWRRVAAPRHKAE